jgi:hypothetical protein
MGEVSGVRLADLIVVPPCFLHRAGQHGAWERPDSFSFRSFCRPSYPAQRIGRVLSAQSPKRVLLAQIPLGQTPSLHLLRHLPVLFGDFPGTMGLSDFPCSFIIGSSP